jgi:hypothetical protein
MILLNDVSGRLVFKNAGRLRWARRGDNVGFALIRPAATFSQPLGEGIYFVGRFGFYKYAAPLALKRVPNAVEPINISKTGAWDSLAGAQDFAGTTWDFAGGVRISREASGISRAEIRILRERFRTTREASGFRGSRADLAGTRQDFAGGPQDFSGASRDVAGTTWDFAGMPETTAADCGSTFTASWRRRLLQIGSHYECFPMCEHFATNSVGDGQL